MIDSTLQAVTQPDAGATDPLHELLRKGARDLIAKAVEAELSTFLEQYANKTLEDGRRAVVRNGYLPERTVQTGIGDVEVKVPRVRDRSGDGVTFSSVLLPPYLKRARSIDELIPWLYRKFLTDPVQHPGVRQAKPGRWGSHTGRRGLNSELKPSGCKSHPAKGSRQPVASLAQHRATGAVKRRQ
jgi:hypothetical protein